MKTKDGNQVTDAMLDAWSEDYETGKWPEGKTVHLGRPRLADEEVKLISFRLPISWIDALDHKVAANGLSRSAGLRKAVEDYLLS